MLRALLVMLPFLIAGPAASATFASPEICIALQDLASEAESSGQRQEVAIIAAEPMVVGCGSEGSAAQRRFCDRLIPRLSLEFPHSLPWKISPCLIDASTETGPGYTGLNGMPRVTRLGGKLPSGVALELVYHPAPDDEPDGSAFKGLYGRYSLTLTP